MFTALWPSPLNGVQCSCHTCSPFPGCSSGPGLSGGGVGAWKRGDDSANPETSVMPLALYFVVFVHVQRYSCLGKIPDQWHTEQKAICGHE